MVQVPGARASTVVSSTAHAGGSAGRPGSGADGHGQAGSRGDGQVPGHADGLHGRRAGRQARPARRRIDWEPGPVWTPNERCSSRAAAKRALPPCVAVILQRPPVRVSTVVPDTAHTSGLSERNDTARPEDAEAGSVTGSPAVTGAPVPSGRRNVIRCDSGPVPIWKARAAPATPNRESPGWVAVITQAPAPTAVAAPVLGAWWGPGGGGAGGGGAGDRAHRRGVGPERDRQPGRRPGAQRDPRACLRGGRRREGDVLTGRPGADLEGVGRSGRREPGVTGPVVVMVHAPRRPRWPSRR